MTKKKKKIENRPTYKQRLAEIDQTCEVMERMGISSIAYRRKKIQKLHQKINRRGRRRAQKR